MMAESGGLKGSGVEVRVSTLVDGGMWVRPLRGDMLRQPQAQPQVRK